MCHRREKMKKSIKVAVVLFSLLALGISTYILTSGMLDMRVPGAPPSSYEKLKITNAYTNATKNAIFVYVSATNSLYNSTANIESAIIKDSVGNSVVVDNNIDFSLSTGQSATVKVNYNSLTSGTYTVTLITTTGSIFVSPSFTVP
jgi:hypothetical protein